MVEFISDTIWLWFFLMERFNYYYYYKFNLFTYRSIKIFYASCVSFGNFYFSRNLSISSRLSNFLAHLFISYCTVTNYHKIHVLRQHKLNIIQVLRSDIWNGFHRAKKSRCWQGCIHSGGSWVGGESVPLPYPMSIGYLYSVACSSFSHLQSQQHCIFKSLTLTLLPPSFSYKNPCDDIGLSR